MELTEFENEIVAQISRNFEDSKEEVPNVGRETGIFGGIEGFDSLRAIEVLVALEVTYDCDFPPEKVFSKKPTNTITIADLASELRTIVEHL